MPRTDQIEIFCSYSHADEELRNEFFRHMERLRESGVIKTWYDRQIGPGEDWRAEIEEHLRSAKVILLLVSEDLLKSEFISSFEVPVALKRHAAHEALVIPVLVRAVNWKSSELSALQGLPDGLRPVVDWTPHDLGWASVCEGLLGAILTWREPGTIAAVPATAATQQRVLDLGLPHRVPVGLSTVLAVMVRRTESKGLAGLMDLEVTYGLKPEEVKSSRAFPIAFPKAADGSREDAELTVAIETADFSYSTALKALWLPPDGDSDVCVFLLKALRTGTLRVNVEVQFRGKRVAGSLLVCSGETGVGYEPAVQASVGLNLQVEPGAIGKRFSESPWAKAAGGIAAGVVLLSGATVLFPMLFQKSAPPNERPPVTVEIKKDAVEPAAVPSASVDAPPAVESHVRPPQQPAASQSVQAAPPVGVEAPGAVQPVRPAQPQVNDRPPVGLPPLPIASPEAMRETLNQLNSRAAVLRTSLQKQKEALAAQGLAVREDLQGAEVRVDLQLRAAAKAIESDQPEEASRSMKTAEEEIARLEKLLQK